MSKYNKVNPGQYSQAGRLTPEETARELTHQRMTAGGERPKTAGAVGRPQTQGAPRSHKGTTKGKR